MNKWFNSPFIMSKLYEVLEKGDFLFTKHIYTMKVAITILLLTGVAKRMDVVPNSIQLVPQWYDSMNMDISPTLKT